MKQENREKPIEIPQVINDKKEETVFEQIDNLKMENNRLLKLYLEICEENQRLKRTLETKIATPSSRKNLASRAIKKYAVSIRDACRMFKVSRTAYYYGCNSNEGSLIETRLLELAKEHPSFGYWKLYYLLRDEGHIVNHKRVYRLYKLFGLKLRTSIYR